MSNDVFTSTGLNEVFHGGTGNDAVVFSGSAAGYEISIDNGHIVIVDVDSNDGDTGIDVLTGIETLSFSDRSYTLHGAVTTGSGGEFWVNTYITNNQTQSRVVGLADGGFVITWHSQETDGSGVYMQRFDASGNALGTEVLVNSSTVYQQQPSVTALNGGGYVVTWMSFGQTPDIYAQRFDANSSPVGGATLVSTSTASYQTNPNIVTLANGSYVITWASNHDGDYDIYFQRFATDGTRIGSETPVNLNTADSESVPEITALTTGGYVVTWQKYTSATKYDVYTQSFDVNGNKVGAQKTIAASANYESTPVTTAVPDGGYVVAWATYIQASASSDVYMTRFDASGNLVGSQIKVTPTAVAGSAIELAITTLANGGYVVAWAASDASGDSNIYAQRYDAANQPTGAMTLVNSYTTGGQVDPSIAALSDGGYLITWSSAGQDGSGSGIYAQRFDANGKPLSSGVELTGTALGDRIAGGFGSQIINGLEGDDTLSGGLGDDTLVGGTGNDLLAGGDGNDIYVLEDADTIFEAANGGIDTVRSSFDYSLSSELENLTLIGSSAVNGVGNDNDNVIIGNSASNILNGQLGDDVLEGGTGLDTLIGGLGNDTYSLHDADTIVEALSEGVDTVHASFSYVLDSNLENLTLIGNAAISGTGNEQNNTIKGNGANNLLNGAGGADTLIGGLGNDTYILNDSDTILEAAAGGIDTVQASFSYTLGSNLEKLTLSGTAVINGTGNNLNNTIIGNSGNNLLAGGAGNDILTGGAGQDIFRFNTTLNTSTNNDTVTDYTAANDTIQLENSIFTKLTATGALSTSNFRANTTGTAADSNDYILYETDTGKLFYDADGNGAGAKIQFALIGTSSHPALTAAEFVVT